jgi:DNA-directed RNA polymerase subunit M/transcription elongation factor TFIIS
MSKEEKVYRHREGTCPKCQGENVSYDGASELQDNEIGYPIKCNDCGFIGKEWYRLTYVETQDLGQ